MGTPTFLIRLFGRREQSGDSHRGTTYLALGVSTLKATPVVK